MKNSNEYLTKFRDVIKESLSKMTVDESIQFMEIFSNKMSKLSIK